MRGSTFVQKANIFAYNATECLRNAYYFNDCTLCIDLCPEDAFRIVRNKLMLFDNECIECAACIGSCPTEALSIDSFDPNFFTIAFKTAEEKTLSCKKNTSCLGIFDAQHYITMALTSESAPICDMAHCSECPVNKEEKVEVQIREKIALANDFMAKVGYESEIVTIEEKPEENARRMLFRKAIDSAKDAFSETSDEVSMTLKSLQRSDADLPVKYILLKNAMKEKMPSFGTTHFEETSPLFFNKTINFDTCTNCGDCVQFCPTHALTATSDKQGIVFTQGKCIGCGICDSICKTNAVSTEESFDLVMVAYDRSEQLVHYEMVMCRECRCPYPYRGGDPICDRCKDFTSNHSNMFTLAKDM